MYVQVLSTYMLHMTGEIGRQGLAHWPIVYGLVLSYEGDRVALDENDALEGKGGKGLRTFAFDAESRSVNWKAMFCRRIDIRVNELGIYIYIFQLRMMIKSVIWRGMNLNFIALMTKERKK